MQKCLKIIAPLILILILISACSDKIENIPKEEIELNETNKYAEEIKDYYSNKYIPKLKDFYQDKIDMCEKEVKEINKTLKQTEEEKYNIVKTHLSCMDTIIERPSRYINTREVCPNCNYWVECTGSMRPTLSCKDTLTVFKPDKDEVNVCDIIMFKSPEIDKDFIIHRIIGKEGSKYITKGDCNMESDEYLVDYDDIMFKVIGIEYGET